MALLDPLMQYTVSVDFDDYPLIGQTASRNQSITTVQASPRVWKFTLDLQTPVLRWDEFRWVVQKIRSRAQFQPFPFTFLNTENLWTLVEYQGVLSSTQLAGLTVADRVQPGPGFLYLTGAPPNTPLCFRQGDYIQTGDSVRTVEYDVTSDATGKMELSLSDPLLTYPAIGSNIIVGKDVTWNNCYFTELPTPGLGCEYMDGITWTGKFKFVQTLS